MTGKRTIMAESEEIAPVYFAISNIPATFRSVDLRNYFSQFIESGGFLCFHYRHRPEILRESEEPENANGEQGTSSTSTADQETKSGSVTKKTVKSCCCVVSVHGKEADRFARMYAGNHWINSKGNWLARRCVIRRVKVANDNGE